MPSETTQAGLRLAPATLAARRRRNYARRYAWFVVPAAAVVVAVILFPWAFTLYVSAFDWRIGGDPSRCFGFEKMRRPVGMRGLRRGAGLARGRVRDLPSGVAHGGSGCGGTLVHLHAADDPGSEVPLATSRRRRMRGRRSSHLRLLRLCRRSPRL